MESNYCLVVGLNRESPKGPKPGYISFFGGRDELGRVANAAFQLGYVGEVRIHGRIERRNGRAKWTKTALLMRKKERVTKGYGDEQEFEGDLKRELNDDQLFEDVYRTRRDVLENSESGRLTIVSDQFAPADKPPPARDLP